MGGCMLKFTIIIILGIILAVISTKFVVKNFLVNYKGSESGFKNVCDILLIVVALFCSLISVWGSFHAREMLITLQDTSGLSEEMIIILKKTLVEQTPGIIKTIILGYVCFTLSYFIFKTIENEIQRDIDKPKRKWDWDKIK
jgi:TRAP-type C4-dicarboxylate transport system permease small subunit